MIVRIDFITGKWIFLGCESHSEESSIINEVVKRATSDGYSGATDRLIANHMVEMWIRAQAERINLTDITQSQEGEDR